MELYTVTNMNGELVMHAPLPTIMQYYRLDPAAARRIENEALIDTGCVLHFGSREDGSYRFITVNAFDADMMAASYNRTIADTGAR